MRIPGEILSGQGEELRNQLLLVTLNFKECPSAWLCDFFSVLSYQNVREIHRKGSRDSPMDRLDAGKGQRKEQTRVAQR